MIEPHSYVICKTALTAHRKQVAQLWQRDRVKLDMFSINVQLYSQNHEQKYIFGPGYGGIRDNISDLSESFYTKKLCSGLYSKELEFYSQKRQIHVLSHPLGELGVT